MQPRQCQAIRSAALALAGLRLRPSLARAADRCDTPGFDALGVAGVSQLDRILGGTRAVIGTLPTA